MVAYFILTSKVNCQRIMKFLILNQEIFVSRMLLSSVLKACFFLFDSHLANLETILLHSLDLLHVVIPNLSLTKFTLTDYGEQVVVEGTIVFLRVCLALNGAAAPCPYPFSATQFQCLFCVLEA